MKRHILKLFLLISAGLSLQSCFNLDEEVFDRVDKSIYYSDETSVKGAVAAIYNKAAMSYVEYFYYLQEFSADQIAWRSWNGGLWGYDEAQKFVLSCQNWNADSKIIQQTWETAWTAIGLCNNVVFDLGQISPDAVGISQEKINSYIAEVRTLRAWAYYNIFEIWGGALPLNVSVSSEVPPSADPDFDKSCKKIYDFIMTELDASVDDLPKNEVNRMNQAANRIIKARLLLNSNIFIGEEHYTECADLCQSIINGDFGNYEIVSDYRKIYDINNNTCPEVIMAFAYEEGKMDGAWMRNMPFLPYNAWDYTGEPISKQDGWNCVCLAPSFDNSGTVLPSGGSEGAKCFLDAPYNDKLGAVYERFSDKDIRKKNYTCDDSGNYSGMFLKGTVKANYGTGEALKADADRDGQDLVYVDQVGTFQNKGRNLETVMSPRWGETNSGVRLIKYPMYQAATGYNFKNIDEVEFRLSEVVFMLAECKMRAGDLNGGKDLVNSVRKRYFSGADWNTEKDNPGRGFSSFDLDWMLNQWGQEFLGEGRRRRTDLRRFDKFTQGQWWFFGRTSETAFNLPAKRDRKYEWYPLPTSALKVNPGLVQNPNYVK